MEFKTQTIKFSNRSSLLILNDDCLLELFKYLSLYDSINLAETCSRLKFVANTAFKRKFSEFTLDKALLNAGNNLTDRIFRHIGRHILSLKIDCGWQINENDLLRKIKFNCDILKSLTLVHCELNDFLKFDVIVCIEMLTLNKCAIELKKDIFKNFFGLKYLHMYHCSGIKHWSLKECFHNNRNISNLAFIGYGFTVLKTVESVLQLDCLTKLKLSCHMQNLNNFLFELASRGILEELELYRIKIDENTFRVLILFERLKLLVVDQCLNFKEFNSSLPSSLKYLQLRCFTFSFKTIASIIRKLKQIENVDLFYCRYSPEEGECVSFDDVTNLSKQILKIMDFGNNQPLLTVTLPEPYARLEDISEKYVCDSRYLRILNNCFVEQCIHTFHPQQVFGSFPGLDYRYF